MYAQTSSSTYTSADYDMPKLITPHYDAVINTPIGKLGIVLIQNLLAQIDFLYRSKVPCKTTNRAAHFIIEQLQAYFADSKHPLHHIPIYQSGTPYQQKVWTALRHIPVGQTLSYGDLAKQLQSGPRAIGGACRSNPTPIIVPCHRIVAAKHIGGFSGAAYKPHAVAEKQWLLAHVGGVAANVHSGESLAIKEWLLRHEQAITDSNGRLGCMQ